MRLLRHLVFLSLIALTATAAQAQNTLGTKLVGLWQEYSPTDNLVSFLKDGTWKLFLTQGEIGNLKSLDGRWSVSEQDGTLVMIVVLGGKEKPMPPLRLSFEGAEMILTDGAGKQTRHRKHQGPIPARYQW
jgi:hypothetical protein